MAAVSDPATQCPRERKCRHASHLLWTWEQRATIKLRLRSLLNAVCLNWYLWVCSVLPGLLGARAANQHWACAQWQAKAGLLLCHRMGHYCAAHMASPRMLQKGKPVDAPSVARPGRRPGLRRSRARSAACRAQSPAPWLPAPGAWATRCPPGQRAERLACAGVFWFCTDCATQTARLCWRDSTKGLGSDATVSRGPHRVLPLCCVSATCSGASSAASTLPLLGVSSGSPASAYVKQTRDI